MTGADKNFKDMPGWDGEIARHLRVAELHPFQKQAVEALMRGQDTFVMVPTAGGKSFCYVIPALLQAGLVLVVSPLIALMRDQLRELEARQIPAAALDSMQTPQEKRAVIESARQGVIRILFVSPERLALPSFREFLVSLNVTLVAIDEAHCVNQWGQDFRPEYLRLGQYLDQIASCPKMALTATATAADREQIQSTLKMRDPELVRSPMLRSNLSLKTIRTRGMDEHKTLLLHGILNETGSGIIYAATRKQVDEIYLMLERAGVQRLDRYHAGLSHEHRLRSQKAFDEDKLQVMVATKAFGMGINKKDIRFVHHASMPANLDSYMQETGRAGRDGQPAHCYLFYGPRDYFIQRFMIERSFPENSLLVKIYHILQDAFYERQVYQEEELIARVCAASELERGDVERVLDFLFRDQILEFLEVQNDSWDMDSSLMKLISWRGGETSILKLSEDLERKKQDRYTRLKAIHEMIKHGQDPVAYMNQYFK